MARPKKIPPEKAAPKKSARIQRPPENHQGANAAARVAGLAPVPHAEPRHELVILTGLSGAGKASALKAFEDMGFYSVDNMPMELIPRFADLVRQSVEIRRAALVVDVREGQTLDRFPALLREVRKTLPTRVLFLDASDAVLL